MEWGEAWRVVKVLDREAIYGAHRGSDPTLDELKLLRLVKLNRAFYLIETAVAVLLILLMIGPPVLLSGPEGLREAVRSSTTLYVMMLFMLVFMMGSTSTLALQEFGHLEVLMQLPLDREDLKKIVMAYLIYEIGPVLVVPPIYAVMVAEKTGLLWAFLTVSLYGYASICLALAASLALSVALWKRRGLVRGLRAKFTRAFWNGLYVMTMFSIGILYQLYAYAESVRAFLGKAVPEAGFLKLVYPFSASESLFCEEPREIALSICSCLAYSLAFYLVLDRMLISYASRTPYMVHETARGGKLVKPRFWLPIPKLAMALKDLKVAMREPRTSYMMVLPLFSVIGFIPALLAPQSPAGLAAYLCLMCMTLFITGSIISSLVPYQLMEHEGGRLWILFSCVPKKDISLSKALASTLAFSAYAFPVALLASALMGSPCPLLYAASGAMVVFSASLLSSMIMIATTSVDTKMVRVSFLKSLALLALSAGLSMPLLAPLLNIRLEQVLVALTREYPKALLLSGLEACSALVLNEVLVR